MTELASIWESRVASQLGIARDVMRSTRKQLLVPGTDWIEDGRVLLTPSAVRKIAAAFNFPPDAAEVLALAGPLAVSEQRASDATGAQIEPKNSTALVQRLRIVKKHRAHPRYLLCAPEGVGDEETHRLCLVRVKDNSDERLKPTDRTGQVRHVEAVRVGDRHFEFLKLLPT